MTPRQITAMVLWLSGCAGAPLVGESSDPPLGVTSIPTRTFAVGQRWVEHVVFEETRRMEGVEGTSEIREETSQTIEADASFRVLSLGADGALGEVELEVRRLVVDEGGGVQPVATPATIALSIDSRGALAAPEEMDPETRELLLRVFDPSTRSRDDSWQETRPFGAEWPVEVELEPRRLAGPTCLASAGDTERDIVGARTIEVGTHPGTLRIGSHGTASHCATLSPMPGTTYESAVLAWDWEASVPVDSSQLATDIERRLEWSAVMNCSGSPACRVSVVVVHRLRIERTTP